MRRPSSPRKGRLILITAALGEMLASALRRGRVRTGTSREDLPSMQRLLSLYEAGGHTPVVGPVLPFEKLPETHRIAESVHKSGNLIVTIGDAT